MASDTSMKSTKAAISLYANLLDPSLDVPAIGTISRAPVVFKQVVDGTSQPEDGAASKQQLSAGRCLWPSRLDFEEATWFNLHCSASNSFSPLSTYQTPAATSAKAKSKRYLSCDYPSAKFKCYSIGASYH